MSRAMACKNEEHMNISEIAKNLLRRGGDWSLESVSSWLLQMGLIETDRNSDRIGFLNPSNSEITYDIYLESPCSVSFIEVNTDVYLDVNSLSKLEYEDKVDEYFEKYEAAVKEISNIIGPPLFSDGAAAKGFPDDQDAVWLALWNGTGSRLMLQQKHEDRDLPFRICLVSTR